jgi:hypothetical protein
VILAGPIELTGVDVTLIVGILVCLAIVGLVALGLLAFVGASLGHVAAHHPKPWYHATGTLKTVPFVAGACCVGLMVVSPPESATSPVVFVVLSMVVALCAGFGIGYSGSGGIDV